MSKKNPIAPKKLALTVETVRRLDPIAPADLREVAGGGEITHTTRRTTNNSK